MSLETRLTRIEHLQGRENTHRSYRFSHIVASEAAAQAVRQDVTNQGYDPDRDLFLIRIKGVHPKKIVATDAHPESQPQPPKK